MAKYYKYTPREIEIYKRERKEAEKGREKKTNNALIALRKQFLITEKESVEFQRKVAHFKKVVKSKPTSDLVNLIQYFLRHD